MSRLLKNPDLTPGALASRLPIVPNNSYGDAPVDGIIRFNQDTSRIEFYYTGGVNPGWHQIAQIGTLPLVIDPFIGDGLTQTFTMSQSETDAKDVAVFIGGVYQQPTINYTVNGLGITFTSAPPAPGVNPNTIIVIHNLNSTNVPA